MVAAAGDDAGCLWFAAAAYHSELPMHLPL